MSAKPDFYSERTVRGRREYRCAFCRRGIEKGALHVQVSSCSCGQFFAHRAHVACHESVTGQKAPPRAAGQPAEPAAAFRAE